MLLSSLARPLRHTHAAWVLGRAALPPPAAAAPALTADHEEGPISLHLKRGDQGLAAAAGGRAAWRRQGARGHPCCSHQLRDGVACWAHQQGVTQQPLAPLRWLTNSSSSSSSSSRAGCIHVQQRQASAHAHQPQHRAVGAAAAHHHWHAAAGYHTSLLRQRSGPLLHQMPLLVHTADGQQQQQQQQVCRALRAAAAATRAMATSSRTSAPQHQARRQGAAPGGRAGSAEGLGLGADAGGADADAPPARAPSSGPRPPPQQRRNHQIAAPQLMVVFPDGAKQVMDTGAARAAAAELRLDLVEVNARASPPVARIMDWGKARYEQQQKAEAVEKQKRLAAKLNTPKQMQFTARIADHDLEVKLRKVHGWLQDGHRVQLLVKHGREEDAAAAEALDYLAARLASDFRLELGQPQQQRRALSLMLKPLGPKE